MLTVLRVLGLGFSSSGALALPMNQGPQPDPDCILPQYCGEWTSPVTLNIPAGYTEIVHVGLLPPSTAGGISAQFQSKAMFIADRSCPATGSAMTFLWDAASPSVVQRIPTNNGGPAVDPFCGGHAFFPDGRWGVFGGTDIPSTCAGPTAGHALVQLWDS